MNITVWILLILSCVSCGLAECFSKLWANSGNKLLLLPIIPFYFISVCFWLYALKKYNIISIVGIAWSILTILITVLLGTLLFNEKMSYFQITGCILALVSLILLNI